MKQGDKVELILEDGKLLGYYQYTERSTVYITMDSGGMFVLGTAKSDIKKIIEL